ncbi:MAG: hypothetical protein M3N23_01960 [Pseudomonadota bacterium]|nr:hypothetical protein [Pseudomonadota bacterium]
MKMFALLAIIAMLAACAAEPTTVASNEVKCAPAEAATGTLIPKKGVCADSSDPEAQQRARDAAEAMRNQQIGNRRIGP